MKEVEKVKLGRLGDRPYWVLFFSIFVRAIHQVGAAVFLASFLLKDIITPPPIYVFIVFVSGAILLGAESIRHRQLLKELAGVSTLVKLVILGLGYHGWIPAMFAALFAFAFASLFSHAPKSIRHRLLF